MDQTAGIASMGPVEFTVLEFPKRAFDGEIATVLADLVERAIVSILDLVIVSKGEDGTLEVIELVDAGPAIAGKFDEVDGEVMWLLSSGDIAEAARTLQPDTTGVFVVWENTWARNLSSAVARAGGKVVVHDRLDADAVASSIASSTGGE